MFAGVYFTVYKDSWKKDRAKRPAFISVLCSLPIVGAILIFISEGTAPAPNYIVGFVIISAFYIAFNISFLFKATQSILKQRYEFGKPYRKQLVDLYEGENLKFVQMYYGFSFRLHRIEMGNSGFSPNCIPIVCAILLNVFIVIAFNSLRGTSFSSNPLNILSLPLIVMPIIIAIVTKSKYKLPKIKF